MLDAFHDERQLTGQDDVDLLLALVAVDAAALAGLQPQQVDPEALDAELPAQRLEPLAGGHVESRARDLRHGAQCYATGPATARSSVGPCTSAPW